MIVTRAGVDPAAVTGRGPETGVVIETATGETGTVTGTVIGAAIATVTGTEIETELEIGTGTATGTGTEIETVIAIASGILGVGVTAACRPVGSEGIAVGAGAGADVEAGAGRDKLHEDRRV